MKNGFYVLLVSFVLGTILSCKDKKPDPVTDNQPEEEIVVTDTLPKDTIEEDTVMTEQEKIIASTPMPKAADELFDDFLFNFTANKKLQMERVVFPLTVMGEGQAPIEKKDWKMEKFFAKQGYYTLIFDNERQLELLKDTTVDSVVVEKIHLNNKTVDQYIFNRRNGAWMLTALQHAAIYQNYNASFLDFYERFARDSVFQTQSLNDKVMMTVPDPDDDFNMIDGEFYPEQWQDFKPGIIPSDLIYNINYGQQYRESTKKIFVIRGVANGLETEMTFQQKGGKWKLTKLVN